ncbi:hypothetical protein C0Q70_10136 [Pomacea canaliculata]|uniref:Uncharacterized protein n=1 Tax=Pomacea canaliculata TaxID=400727 RepID=A0A2T7PBR9_POMCA|nr:uncharacterized protein LOC112565284 [Pomacea canaliculata]PVD30861.1 hypothetical protein C0Q70_10136 [Pomacea canaliculata]
MPAAAVSVNSLRGRRPGTSCSLRRTSARQKSGDKLKENGNPRTDDASQGHEIELLEYEWPDLPPLPALKDAVTRSRVSFGISYLLPVDKGRNSINNHFRTDLRAMFQEPYASDDLRYDDGRVKLSAAVHFLCNTSATKWTRRHLQSVPVILNAESEKARQLYCRSAPSSGVASQRMGIDPLKLRTRSNLFRPLKAAVPPELIKLRKEVEEIVRSVQEEVEALEEQKIAATQPAALVPSRDQDPSAPEAGGNRVQAEACAVIVDKDGSVGAIPESTKQVSQTSPGKYETYEILKAAKPPKPLLPDSIKSQYLSAEKSQDIWEWLHHGEEQSDFDFFLSVCG